MGKFTPGPWVVAGNEEKFEGVTIAIVGEVRVAKPTPGIPGGNYRDTHWGFDEDDAKLIAAAPDLYEALQCFSPHRIGTGNSLNHETLAAAWAKAQAALAKAKGKS